MAKKTPLCDAILAVESDVGDETATKDDARTSLRNALEADDLYVETVGQDLCIGNLRGIEYARHKASETISKREWLPWKRGKSSRTLKSHHSKTVLPT